MAERKENIVMFPFMAQGHIIPFLALALHLENTNKYTVTFVNTHSNIKNLKSSLPPNSSIRLHEIPFNSIDHNLPPCTENTDSIPYHLFPNFLLSTLSFKPHFKKLISDLIHEQNGQKPLCIIGDMFFGWCEEIAQEFGVFHALFIGGGGFGFACFYSLWLNLSHRNCTDSDEFALPDFPEASRIHINQMTEYLRVAHRNDSFTVFYKKLLLLWMNADGILVNTVEEIDKLGLTYFRRKLGRLVFPIGPVLLSTESQARAGKESGISVELCRNWLNSKPYNSVLYVSFGSQNTIAASQMMQLAMGLEASGQNFIWVVRPPIGFDINSEFKADKWLPEGFEGRIKDSGRGLIIRRWAPQVEILSHKSVSAFLSHCGWNYVLEALSNGVPIIGWPLGAEQFYNSKLLAEEIDVCVEVARGTSCEVLHEDIAEKIELVMNETDKGKEMRRKASEVREIIKNSVKNKENFQGSSVKAMEQFLNAAFMMRENQRMSYDA